MLEGIKLLLNYHTNPFDLLELYNLRWEIYVKAMF
jgi:hypothetical protein